MRKTFLFFLIALFLAILFFLIWIQDEYNCPKENGRDECILNLIREKNGSLEPDICNEIIDFSNRDICYFSLSEYHSGQEAVSLCNMISSTNSSGHYNKDNCIFNKIS